MPANTGSAQGEIVLDQVSRRHHDGTKALDQVSLRIPRGQFCVILGSSGAGKSTLLRLINGMERHTGGDVHVAGMRPGARGWRRVQHRLAMIHQQFNLVARTTVARNVLNGALPATPAWRALFGRFPRTLRLTAARRLREVGLDETHAVRRAGELSGGQQQRVGIARAFMLDPEIVLADEPVASLDPHSSREIMGLLREEARRCRATVVCSLHQVELAREFADRIVGMRAGKIVFDGAPSELSDSVARSLYGTNDAPPTGDAVSASPSSAGASPVPGKNTAWWDKPALSGKTMAVAAAAALLLGWTGHRTQVDQLPEMTARLIAAPPSAASAEGSSGGFGHVLRSLWPPEFSEVTPVDRIANFDPAKLPPGARLETRHERGVRIDPVSLQMEPQDKTETVLVKPFGYLWRVIGKTLESVETGLWGTVLAMLLSLPLSVLAARNYTPHPLVYMTMRAVVAALRAVPEMISALFFVLAFGFGPLAGVMALALHAAGFLGKFYAEDIENAPVGPQRALAALGIRPWRVLRAAVLPEVFPQYVAYTLYVLDRNVRMATVIGLVGAGGIGQELKGRYDLFEYHHVGTILLALFVTVFLLDQLSARVRRMLL